MGKLDIDPIIQHFSHQHPLELLNFQPQTTNKVACAGCELEVSGWIYSCTACNYCLHKACSQMPQCKNLQIDQKHTLKLISSPVYPGGIFKCNACGKPGKGFCYHCKECQLDIHTLCAFKPSSVNIKTHHHTLNLCFDPPYQKKRFQCDICKGFGSNHWLYRCGSCNFDTHMNCAMANLQSQSTSGIQQKQPNFQPQPAPAPDPDPAPASGIQQKQPNFQSQPTPEIQERKLNFQPKPTPTSGIQQTQPNFQPQPTSGFQLKQPNFQYQPASGNQLMNHHHHHNYQQLQQHQLLNTKSVPPQIPNHNLVQTVHHLPPPPPQQQIWSPHIQTQNPIPQVESLNMSQPIVYVPQYVQPPRTNTMANDMLGFVVKGVTQQAAQVMFETILGGVPDSLSQDMDISAIFN